MKTQSEKSYLLALIAQVTGKIERNRRDEAAASAKHIAINECLWDQKNALEHRLKDLEEANNDN